MLLLEVSVFTLNDCHWFMAMVNWFMAMVRVILTNFIFFAEFLWGSEVACLCK
jgi:hypothetical protein